MIKPYFSDAWMKGFTPDFPRADGSNTKVMECSISALNDCGRYKANVSLLFFPTGMESRITPFSNKFWEKVCVEIKNSKQIKILSTYSRCLDVCHKDT